MNNVLTEDRFFADIADHAMTVIRDDGFYRHIRFSQPGTICMHFDLITWPGYLCYCGDMGTYVFERITDMFEFFRTDREYAMKRGRRLSVNLGYWSEKLQAVDGNRHSGSALEYSPEMFERAVKERLVTWWRECGLDRKGRRELREEVENNVLNSAHDGDVRAFDAANEFHTEINGKEFQFRDFWDVNIKDYTHSFQWCCYALAWGIGQYDDAKQVLTEEVPA